MASEEFAKRFKNKSNLLGKTGLIEFSNINAIEKLEIPPTKVYKHIGIFSPCLDRKKKFSPLNYCPSAQILKKSSLTPLIITRNSKNALKRNLSNSMLRTKSPVSSVACSKLQVLSLSKCKELPLKLPSVYLNKQYMAHKAKEQAKVNINRDKYQ